jgi:hypothetical protein
LRRRPHPRPPCVPSSEEMRCRWRVGAAELSAEAAAVLSAGRSSRRRFLAGGWGSGLRGGRHHPGREEGRWPSGRRSLVGGAPADDGAAAVHGRRGGALAEDGGDPRGEGAGPSQTTAGCSWRSVGHSWRTAGWSEGRQLSGMTAALGEKIWQPDGVVSFRARLRKISRACLVYI